MNLLVTSFKAGRKLKYMLVTPWYNTFGKIILMLNGVRFGQKINIKGLMKVHVTRRGQVSIGDNFRLNSGNNFNIIGRQQKCIFWVEGVLEIGDNVGMSATALICKERIKIGNSVIIGGNTVIYDSDFHSLNSAMRNDRDEDIKNAKNAPVEIGNNVFIGAHTTILKGVKIGDNSIIGACSVIAKNIPENEVWAGNPAVFIKKIECEKG
jgi:acetyltransferase-like isoleucine patch superfamily enzyme